MAKIKISRYTKVLDTQKVSKSVSRVILTLRTVILVINLVVKAKSPIALYKRPTVKGLQGLFFKKIRLRRSQNEASYKLIMTLTAILIGLQFLKNRPSDCHSQRFSMSVFRQISSPTASAFRYEFNANLNSN